MLSNSPTGALGIAAAGVLALVLTLGGCTRSADSGAGTLVTQRIDACIGVYIYQRLAEPDPSDAKAVRRYADVTTSALEHTDPELEYDDRRHDRVPPPQQVKDDLLTVQRSLVRFRDAVRAAQATGSPAGVRDGLRQAHAVLAADTAFTTADRRLEDFKTTECRRYS